VSGERVESEVFEMERVKSCQKWSLNARSVLILAPVEKYSLFLNGTLRTAICDAPEQLLLKVIWQFDSRSREFVAVAQVHSSGASTRLELANDTNAERKAAREENRPKCLWPVERARTGLCSIQGERIRV